jgi:hypothetical protein
MFLGILSAESPLVLEFNPAHSPGDLLTQHLDAPEQDAEDKGGVQRLRAERFTMDDECAEPSASTRGR